MDFKIQEINYEEENLLRYNLTIGQELLVLGTDYENYKAKLQNYNRALEELNLKVLTFKSFVTKHFHDKKKLNNIKISKNNVKELIILNKLFIINLRSFRVQRLYEENFDLLQLLKSCQFFNEKKQELKKMNDRNQNLQTGKKYFKTRLRYLLNELHNTSNGFRVNRYFTTEAFPGQNPSRALPVIITSKNKSILLDKITEYIKLYNENFRSRDLEIMLNQLSALSIPINYAVNHYSNLKSISQGKRLCKNIEESHFLKIFNNEKSTQLEFDKFNNPKTVSEEIEFVSCMQSKIIGINNDSFECENINNFVCEGSDVLFKILNNFNSLMWNQLPFITCLQKVVTLLTIYNNNSRTILDTPKYQHLKEISYNTVHRKHLQPENINEINSYQKFLNLTEEKVSDKVISKGINKYVQKCKRKRNAHFTYNPNDIHKYSKYYKNLGTGQFNGKRKVNVGIGEGSTLLFDQECQVDFLNFVDINESNNALHIGTIYPSANKIQNLLKAQSSKNIDKVAEIDTRSHQDLKKSLLSLQQIMEYCKAESEEDLTNSKKIKKKKSKLNRYTSKNHKLRNITEEATSKKNTFYPYKKENYALKKMPEMSRLYQIVLKNETPEGLSLKFLKFNKLNGDTFFIKHPHKLLKKRIKD